MTTMIRRARLFLTISPLGAAVLSGCRGDDPDAATSDTTAAGSEDDGGTGLASSSSSGADGDDDGASTGGSTTQGTSGGAESSSTAASSETGTNGTDTTGGEPLPLPEACVAGCDLFAGCAGQDFETCVTGCSASGDLGPECAEATAVAMTCVSTSNCDDIYLDCGAELEVAQMACQGGIDPPQPG